MICYCENCAKTNGPNNPNLHGWSNSMVVYTRKPGSQQYDCFRGPDQWHAKNIQEPAFKSNIEPMRIHCSSQFHHRYFCSDCGTHLFAFSPEWPDLVHPVASSIDEPIDLLTPPSRVYIFMKSKRPWMMGPEKDGAQYDEYPEESLEQWHRKNGKWINP